MIRDYLKDTTVTLSRRDIVLLGSLILLGIGLTSIYIFFAGELGFNVYPEFQIALLVLLLLAAPVLSSAAGRVSGKKFHISGTTLVIALLLTVTFALRLFFALYSSLFPDEYWVLLVLRSDPIHNLSYFFSNYVSLTDRYARHPPLSFLLMSLSYDIFPSPIAARMVAVILGTASVALVYFVVRELAGESYALPAAALYGLFPQTILYLSVALTDVFMNFFGLLSLLFGLKLLRQGRLLYSVISGIALGLSLLSKQGLGILWGILLLFAALLIRHDRVTLRRGLAAAALSLVLGFGVFSLWLLASPQAFWLSVFGIIGFLLTVPPNPQAYNLGACCFQAVNGMTAHISYADLIVQLPVWLTPLVVLLGLIGIGAALRRHQREDIWWALWGVGPLIAMIPGIRDIRYALFIAPPVAYLALLGVANLGRRNRRPALALIMIFLVLFISITAAVAQQQYWGVQESSDRIISLGYGKGVVLTNVPEIVYTMPQAKIVTLLTYDNWTQVNQAIHEKNVTSVIVIHNSRAPWPIVPVQVTNQLRNSFPGYQSGAISGFASYEIFYGNY